MTAEKPRRIGKGLAALISSAASPSASPSLPGSDLQRIPISRVRPNPFQPRRDFDPGELAELEASLKASGLIQPISVRRSGDAFELVAGERRLRAATNLAWTEITAIIQDFDDQAMLVNALVENLQRADLNPIEEARGYKRLVDDFDLTQQQIAEAVGKDRTTVTNLLRVLALPDSVLEMVEQGQLTGGHARALLALGGHEDLLQLAKEAADTGVSVRELERRVRELMTPAGSPPATAKPRATQQAQPPTANSAVRRIEDDLRRYLQTDVHIRLDAESRGTIELAFYSVDDLDRLLELVLRDLKRDF